MANLGILLRCMQESGSFNNSTGALNDFQLAIDDELHGVHLMEKDGVPIFRGDKNEDTQQIEQSEAMIAAFHSLNTSLTVEPIVDGVSIESPPSLDLPYHSLWARVAVPASSTDSDGTRQRRFIYLRPGDTVVFSHQNLKVKIVPHSPERIIVSADGVEVQVKSSIADLETAADGVHARVSPEGEETDDDDDLDASVQASTRTPVADEVELTPTTSRPAEGAVAVKETPCKPISAGDNLVFSTAPDEPHSSHLRSSTDEPYMDSPSALAAESQKKRSKPQHTQIEESGDSQFIFARKEQTTYGARKKQTIPKAPELVVSSPLAPSVPGAEKPAQAYDQSSEPLDEAGAAREVASRSSRHSSRFSLSPDHVEEALDLTVSGRKRKRVGDVDISASNSIKVKEDEDISVNPPAKKTKKARGRGAETAQVQQASKKEIEAAQHPSPPSSSNLKKLNRGESYNEFEEGTRANPLTSTHQPSSALVRISHAKATFSEHSPISSSTAKMPTKILLSASSHSGSKKTKDWLSKHGATIEDKVPSKRVDFVCVVGNGELHTTVKLLRSLAMNKMVITDQWLTDSMQADHLLDLEAYMHGDIATVDRSTTFAGHKLYFTTKLQQSYGLAFKDVEALAKEAGATSAERASSARKAATVKSRSSTVYLGDATDDPIAKELIDDYDKTVYTRDLLTQSIIRGQLLLDADELRVQEKPRAKTRKR